MVIVEVCDKCYSPNVRKSQCFKNKKTCDDCGHIFVQELGANNE